MIKKWSCLAFAVMLILGMEIPVFAAEGSILVNTAGERTALYQVGTAEGDGYRLSDSYGGGYLTFDDTLSQALADWLSERAPADEKIESDGNGKRFSNLEEGLYLVRSDDENPFPPFLVIIPWDGYHWDVEVEPLNPLPPQTGDLIGIVFLTMALSGAGILCLWKRKNDIDK